MVGAPATQRISTGNGAQRQDSLRGTEVDGAVHVDADGRLIGDRDLRQLFDYHLTRLGEEPLEAIRARLQDYLQQRVGAAVVAQALTRFDAYVALQQEIATLRAGDDPRADALRLHALHRRYLGDALADAWYGEEERRLDYTLSRRELLHDSRLSAAERSARLQALDAGLDPATRAMMVEADASTLAMEQSDDFAARNVPPAQRFEEREALFGREAAQRLAALDTQQAQWDERLRNYATQRRQLLAQHDLSDAQRAQALQRLLAGFDPNDRRRVEMLTRNDALPKP